MADCASRSLDRDTFTFRSGKVSMKSFSASSHLSTSSRASAKVGHIVFGCYRLAGKMRLWIVLIWRSQLASPSVSASLLISHKQLCHHHLRSLTCLTCLTCRKSQKCRKRFRRWSHHSRRPSVAAPRRCITPPLPRDRAGSALVVVAAAGGIAGGINRRSAADDQYHSSKFLRLRHVRPTAGQGRCAGVRRERQTTSNARVTICVSHIM